MRRGELKVGDELYWATPSDWSHNYTGRKVTVLHVEAYSRNYSHKIQATYDGKGGGVHVTVHQPGSSNREDVVRLGDLRGPWETTLAAVEERQKRNREQARQDGERAATRVALSSAVAARAVAEGAASARRDYNSPGGIWIRAEDLGALLDRIEALTARVIELEDEINDIKADASRGGYES